MGEGYAVDREGNYVSTVSEDDAGDVVVSFNRRCFHSKKPWYGAHIMFCQCDALACGGAHGHIVLRSGTVVKAPIRSHDYLNIVVAFLRKHIPDLQVLGEEGLRRSNLTTWEVLNQSDKSLRHLCHIGTEGEKKKNELMERIRRLKEETKRRLAVPLEERTAKLDEALKKIGWGRFFFSDQMTGMYHAKLEREELDRYTNYLEDIEHGKIEIFYLSDIEYEEDDLRHPPWERRAAEVEHRFVSWGVD